MGPAEQVKYRQENRRIQNAFFAQYRLHQGKPHKGAIGIDGRKFEDPAGPFRLTVKKEPGQQDGHKKGAYRHQGSKPQTFQGNIFPADLKAADDHTGGYQVDQDGVDLVGPPVWKAYAACTRPRPRRSSQTGLGPFRPR